MIDKDVLSRVKAKGRTLENARSGDEELGHLSQLPGVWANKPSLPGRGWNMIALPFSGGAFKYRLLLNQYNEQLVFRVADKAVPNRGLPVGVDPVADQTVIALDYQQSIAQIASLDSPQSGNEGDVCKVIHHEPGLFLNMVDRITDNIEVARLGTIPHGNAVLALGRVSSHEGAPVIPDIDGLPIGSTADIENPYLSPYKEFNDTPFKGLFNPVRPNDLLKQANSSVNIVRHTHFRFDTTLQQAGIVNIPFIEQQADASEMVADFWIQEMDEVTPDGSPKLRMQYSQVVMLDFFDRTDGQPGRIKWPHVSINTLEKVSNSPDDALDMADLSQLC